MPMTLMISKSVAKSVWCILSSIFHKGIKHEDTRYKRAVKWNKKQKSELNEIEGKKCRSLQDPAYFCSQPAYLLAVKFSFLPDPVQQQRD